MTNATDFLCISKHENGRSLADVLVQDDDFWERNHDFIQWLFPLTEPSKSNRKAPVLSQEDVDLIRSSDSAQENLQRAIIRFKEFLACSTKWRQGYDHNHLRISRAIKSLRLLVDEDTANNFKHWVARELGDDIDRIHPESKKHWRLS